MDIPKYALDAARAEAAMYGGDPNIFNAFLKGFGLGNRDRRTDGHALKPIADEYTFERWWDLYDYKKGREKCEVKWHNRMTRSERKAATEHTPSYVASTPDKQYRKHPYTYLTQKCWQDAEQMPVQMSAKADAAKFMEYFNKVFEYTDIPKLSVMTEERTRMLNYIYGTFPHDILTVLDKVRDSRHLTGEDGKGFTATFEWIFTPRFFIQIREGYYDD
jgi:hypothetical protein